MHRTVIAICVLALVLAACGGADTADNDTSNPTDTVAGNTETTEASGGGDEEPPNDPGSSGLPSGNGVVTVGGETYSSVMVLNCIIDEQFDPQPGDLDLTASLEGGLDALFIGFGTVDIPMGPDSVPFESVNANMQIRGDSGEMLLYEGVSYAQGPDGLWYDDGDAAAGFAIARGDTPESDPLDFVPWSLDGDNATGTLLLDAGSGPVEVTYDLTIPELFDCSL